MRSNCSPGMATGIFADFSTTDRRWVPMQIRRPASIRSRSPGQPWAQAPPARVRRAMESADRILADSTNHLVRLFTPPFDHSTPHPGYIMGYPPGLRENGGQYTHGSLWLAMARARMGQGRQAVR